MYQRFASLFAVVALCLVAAVPSFAAVTNGVLTLPDLDLTNYTAAAVTVVGGLAVIWGVRKLIKLFNRS